MQRVPFSLQLADRFLQPRERVVVVDLPVDERHQIYQGGSAGEPVRSELGPVEFAFHSMVDLGRYDDGSFDLVYSGQSIEHVTEAEGDEVVRRQSSMDQPDLSHRVNDRMLWTPAEFL